MRLVEGGGHLSVLLGDDRLEVFPLALEDEVDVERFQLFGSALLLLALGQFLLELLLLLLVLDIADHAGEVPEEALGVVVDVVLLLRLEAEVVLLLDNLLALLPGQLLQVLLVEQQHDLLDVRVEFADEGVDDALGGVEDVEAADMVEQLTELVVDLPLIFVLLVLLLDLALEDLEELRLEQHLLDGYEDLQDHLKHLALGKLITYAVGDDDLVVDQLVPVEVDQVVELVVDDLELLPDELLEEEDVPVLVDVVEPVQVGPQGAPDLPPVGVLEALEAVGVGVDVFQLADVDEVLALNHHRKQLEEAGHVALLGREGEVVPAVGEVHLALEDELLEAVVLEPVHEYLLVDPEPLVVQQQDAPQRVEDLALLEVVVHQRLPLVLEDVVVDYLLAVELDAGLQRPVDD